MLFLAALHSLAWGTPPLPIRRCVRLTRLPSRRTPNLSCQRVGIISAFIRKPYSGETVVTQLHPICGEALNLVNSELVVPGQLVAGPIKRLYRPSAASVSRALKQTTKSFASTPKLNAHLGVKNALVTQHLTVQITNCIKQEQIPADLELINTRH